ncbi:mRNA cap guanine-N7 methyltransferase [Giardia muris]|uniref:mRNA (guanine-N(7))-methyltransferase n=1 Tax=Giardia muris TaxID=5742 RepID=A0A4Z1SWI4_GIAMU|nr:mRNA cap guanine-N7 methyltransferase [Giardia muris]|eukprot:TNJ30096.1 mRNA cap guanine-N7 methyltransferase [Giardia muris]
MFSDSGTFTMHPTAESIWHQYAAIRGGGTGDERLRSRILPIRDFNNWAKRALIGHFLHATASAQGRNGEVLVMDICCGKGGDLQKFRHDHVRYVACIDVSLESLVEAIHRYNGMRNTLRYQADFIWADIFAVPIAQHFRPYQRGVRFGLISCQFALHYAFETEERARMLFKNVSDCLDNKGRFIAIFVSKESILSRLESKGYVWSPTNKDRPPVLNNGLYTIRFEGPFTENPYSPHYGVKYYFDLEEAVNDIPEYFVDYSSVMALCEEFKLRIAHHFGTLEDFYRQYFEWHTDQHSRTEFARRMDRSSQMLARKVEDAQGDGDDFFGEAFVDGDYQDAEEPMDGGGDGNATEFGIRHFADLPERYREVINLYQAVVIERVEAHGLSMNLNCRTTVARRVADITNLTPHAIDRAALREYFAPYMWQPGKGHIKC